MIDVVSDSIPALIPGEERGIVVDLHLRSWPTGFPLEGGRVLWGVAITSIWAAVQCRRSH